VYFCFKKEIKNKKEEILPIVISKAFFFLLF